MVRSYSYIQEIFNGKEYYVSEIYPSIFRDNPIFVISCPIKHNNELVGVAIISPQMSYFTQKFIESINLQETGYMFFVDERGLIIAHKNREYILKEPEKVDKLFHNVITRVLNDETNFQEEFLGDKKLYASTKVKIDEKHLKYGWYIIFTQKNEEIFSGTSKLLHFIITMAIISAMLIAVIIYTILKIYDKKNHEENLIEMNKSLEKKVNERTKELQELAITDSLTKLLNHNTSYELLENEINKAGKTLNPLSIIMLDLDHFKQVNDNYGHQVGDEVLISVVQVIKSNIREIDIAGRYGGEEFIIILPDTDNNTAFMFADRLRTLISQITFDYEELYITASLGVCSWCGENGVELVSKADKLLYKAKENGRNRVEISTIDIMKF